MSSKTTMKRPTLKQYILRQPSQTYATDNKPNPNCFSSYSQLTKATSYSTNSLPISSTSSSIPFDESRGSSAHYDSVSQTTSRVIGRRHKARPTLQNSTPEQQNTLSSAALDSQPPPAPTDEAAVSDSDDDTTFHTPLSTPDATPTPESSSPMFEPFLLPALDKHMVPVFEPLDRPDLVVPPFTTRTDSSSSLPSTSSQRSDPDEDKISSRSWSSHSDSTTLTTPTSSTTSRSSSPRAPGDNTPRRDAKTTRHPDWAQDPRWLAPAERTSWVPPQPSDSVRRRSNTISSGTTASTVTARIDPMTQHLQVIASSSAGFSQSMLAPPPRRRKSRRSHSSQWSSRSVSEKMSFILEEDESEDGTTSGSITPPSPAPERRPRPRSAPTRRYTSSVYSTSSRNSYTSIARTVMLPSPLPASHGSSAVYGAYGSLVLPRAAFTPSKHPDRISSQIDITKSGLAQTTMSTIEVTRGAAVKSSRARSPTRSHRLSIFGSSAAPSPTPAHLLANVPPPLSFTSHTPPPNKLQSGQVLVQVFMVALDGLDALLVKEKVAKSSGYGFVPGRSFVGRAIECGFEVRNVCKGDWVYGLLDLAKCGALAEFIVVDRRRLHRAPQVLKSQLSLEQIASLPLSGVPAHRTIRTLRAPAKGNRALVLNAHDGVGALVTQILASHGVEVTGQVPADTRGSDEEDLSEEEKVTEKAPISFEARVRLFGAKEVKIGDPLVVIAELGESYFDFVIDTAGSRRIWDASRWILRSSGQFTTVIGDDTNLVPLMNSNLKSNLRSIRGAIKREQSYEWVLPNAELDTEGEDVRDALGALAKMAEAGLVTPWAKWAVPFEQAPKAFVPSRELLQHGGIVVVKILG